MAQRTQSAEPSATQRRRWTGLIVGLVILVVGVCLGAVGGLGLGSDYVTFTVATNSMNSTLATGDRLLLRKPGQDGPRRGDIVLVAPSTRSDLPPGDMLVRRVIGIGGDTVTCCDDHGRIAVNGHAVAEDYLRPDPGLPQVAESVHLPFDVKVLPGKAFLAGDDRGNSVDSRLRGAEPVSDILGIAVTNASVPGFRRIPATNAFVAAGLPGPAPRAGISYLDPALLLAGAVLVLIGLAWSIWKRPRRR
ncbi:MAG TPA: signal peptidase I [Pseudonocardiaceae bacterium]|nr:signal peptidase I [Pseudonocardiaceae bacterium]